MDNVRLRIQIDFGVGDVMTPGPRLIEYPALLESDTIRLLAYPIESAIAEKLQAMVALGGANSRMKDFYDVWMCSRHLELSGDTLASAIEATFRNRKTSVPMVLDALTSRFADEHRAQWNAFAKKIGEDSLRDELGRIIEDLNVFVHPLLQSLTTGEKLRDRWTAQTGWTRSN